MKRNSLLDCLKGLACIFVVFIHAPFPGKIGVAITALAGFAVPLFLMTSGYYAYGCDFAIIKRRAIRIVKITCFAVVCYSLLAVFRALLFHSLFEIKQELFLPKTWVHIFFLQDFGVIHAGHLWFLPALALAYLVLLFVKTTGRGYKFFVLVLFINMFAISTLTMTNGGSNHLRDNFLAYALPYVLLGYWFASKEKHISQISNELLLALAVAGAAFNVVCMEMPLKPNMYQFGACLNAVCLFIFAVNNSNRSMGIWLEKLGKELSMWVYIVHFAVAGALKTLADFCGAASKTLVLWMIPIITVFFSVFLSRCILLVLKKKNLINRVSPN